MANPIHCDFEGCAELADWLVSNLTDGESLAWCNLHYAELVQMMASAAAGDGEPLPVPPPPAAPITADEPTPEQLAASLEAAERLEALGATEGADSVLAVLGPSPEPQQGAAAALEAPAGTTVVRRGTSASRRRHQAKQKAAQRAAEETEP